MLFIFSFALQVELCGNFNLIEVEILYTYVNISTLSIIKTIECCHLTINFLLITKKILQLRFRFDNLFYKSRIIYQK